MNFGAQAANDDHESDFWKQRNLIPGAAGSKVPLLLTQGLTENNTVADGLQQYLDNHSGYERAWLGPWEHVRGNETDPDTGKLKMGRAGWFDEVMRFYDRFLKGISPTVGDPPVAVQTNDGKWRSEAQWPPADRASYTTALRAGSYNDTAQSYATGAADDPTSNSGVWTISKPLPYDLHLAGSGTMVVDVTTTLPNANLAVDVYDLDANGTGPLITRQGHLVRERGQLLDPARAVVGRLEARSRSSHRRARDRQQPGLVAAGGADAADGHGQGRIGDAALPALPAHADHPGRPRHPARGLPRATPSPSPPPPWRLAGELHAAARAADRPGGIGLHRRLHGASPP